MSAIPSELTVPADRPRDAASRGLGAQRHRVDRLERRSDQFCKAPAMVLLALSLSACGASQVDRPSAPEPEPTPVAAAEPAPEPVETTPEPEPEPEPQPEPRPPPEPEPIVVEAGAQLGPIRIDMSESDVRALGLEEAPSDEPGSLRFGPYRVFFDAHGARRVEALIGDLGRIRIGDDVIASGTHIHQIRDTLGDCEWHEGGGERYRCRGGTLFVHTTHTMDPARYTIAVQRR